MQWISHSASVLINAIDSQATDGALPLSEFVGAERAIYMWRRTIKAPHKASISASHAMDWILECVTTTVGRIENQRVNHGLNIDLVFQPSTLTPEKQKTLQNVLENSKKRKAVLSVIESLSAATPALYVGQTKNVRRRVYEHLTNRTDFGKAVEEHISTKWENLEFSYLSLGPYSEADDKFPIQRDRELFELIAAKLTVAAFTKRPG